MLIRSSGTTSGSGLRVGFLASAAWGTRGCSVTSTVESRENPRSLEEALPLFDALTHACRAGLQAEAFEPVYLKRIARSSRRFVRRRVPASGAHLSALTHFFEIPWSQPSPELNEEERIRLWEETGHYLFALGHPEEATAPLTSAYEAHCEASRWDRASYVARILRESYLIQGDLGEAYRSAKDSVTAGKDADLYHRMSSLSGLAQVLHHQGHWADAERCFQAAEVAHNEYDYKWYEPEDVPETMVFVWGFWYAEYLLDQVERQSVIPIDELREDWPIERHSLGEGFTAPLLEEIRSRASVSIELARKEMSSFDIAQDSVTLGRLETIGWKSNGESASNPGAARLELAVALLRQINQQHHLVAAILQLADAYRLEQRHDDARVLIEEAEEISILSGMRLFESRCALKHARVHCDQGNVEEGRKRLATATKSMAEMRCHRWDHWIEKCRRELQASESSSGS